MTAREAFPVVLSLALLPAVAAVVCVQERPVDATAEGERARIQKLIKQLGDNRFEIREQAMGELVALGERALDAVEEARRSDDVEVRVRAERILELIPRDVRRRHAERQVRATMTRIQSMPIDQFIDQMAARERLDTPENWARLHDLATAMTKLASRESPGREWSAPKLRYRTFPTVATPLETNRVYQRSKVRVDGVKGAGQSFEECVLVSSDLLPTLETLSASIVFLNGDLVGCASITDSFVFCNGNIGRVTRIKNSVIVATGGIERLARADHAVFQVKRIVGEKNYNSFECVYLTTPVIFAGGAHLIGGASLGNAQGPIGPLPFIKPFKPASLGIEFSEVDGRVRIDKVHENRAFARAGLRAGDVVLAAGKEDFEGRKMAEQKDEAPAKPIVRGTRVGGDPTSTPGFVNTPFHKFLRRRLPGDEFVLKVRRGESILECKVKLPD